MEFRKVTAIVRRERLEDVERRLIEIGVAGVTVTAVKGFGEYANFFRGDWLVPHVRLEIFTLADRAEAQFLLARALGRAGQRGRAVPLARLARETYAENAGANQASIGQIDAWLGRQGRR